MLTKERLDELLAYDPETGLFTWKVRINGRIRVGDEAGRTNTSGHIQITISRSSYCAHRLAFLAMTGRWPENEVDHINGNPADNRWVNLRPATRVENMRNQRTNARNTSGVTGVSWDTRRGKWMAFIQTNRKTTHLGYFTKFEDAVAARRAAEVKYFGEFSATASRSAA